MRICQPDREGVFFKQRRTKGTLQGNYMVNEGAKVNKLITFPNTGKYSLMPSKKENFLSNLPEPAVSVF